MEFSSVGFLHSHSVVAWSTSGYASPFAGAAVFSVSEIDRLFIIYFHSIFHNTFVQKTERDDLLLWSMGTTTSAIPTKIERYKPANVQRNERVRTRQNLDSEIPLKSHKRPRTPLALTFWSPRGPESGRVVNLNWKIFLFKQDYPNIERSAPRNYLYLWPFSGPRNDALSRSFSSTMLQQPVRPSSK